VTAEAQPEFLSVTTVATRLGLGKMTVYRMVESGEIPGAIRLHGRTIRIHAATFNAWIAEQVSS
jgi:excisionase family DNA binding protein